MVASRFDVSSLSSVAEHDSALLSRLCASVNQTYFSGKISIAARWDVPSASESPEPVLDISKLSQTQLAGLTKAVEAFAKRNFEAAKALIIPLAQQGIREASHLYVRCLMELKDPSWSEAAKRLNKVCTDTLIVPAGSTEIVDGAEYIHIHPALSKSAGYNAPRYVIRYVLFHEQLHKFMRTSPSNPHPPLFKEMEQACTDRPEAIAWLQKHQFSTIEDALV
ncbi:MULTISPECIES: M48 family metallopeptidase [Pseudomonas]|uniref:Uncharacterized protein n=1 Tax=Pseudomonas fluorescens TaxID=294 RepID=A0A166QNW7_PSEFL|nr:MULTISPECIES: M48 family metallopeptidase [Pseudomonas]KZN20610.1 hypothetical protein A1D17_03465 [Pseudomonas fluorescens]